MDSLTLFTTQKLCFEMADKLKHSFYFALDKNDKGGKEYGSSKFVSDFLEIYNALEDSQKNFYELLRVNMPRYEYYDIDMKTASTPTEIFCKFNSIRLKFVRNELGYDFPADWRVTDSSRYIEEEGLWKVSLHLVNRAVVFKDGHQTKQWYDKLDEYNKAHHNIKDLFDISVCSKNRCMRMIGSSKFGQTRPLQKDRHSEKYPMHDFFISNVNGNWETGDILSSIFQKEDELEIEYKATDKKRLNFEKTMKPVILASEGDEVETLIDLISSSILSGKHSLCDNGNGNLTYVNFRNLAFAVLSSGGTSETLQEHVFPLYRHASQYDCIQMCNHLALSASREKGYTIASLHYWAKQNERYSELFTSKKYHSTGKFKVYDTYSWADFKEEMECSVFDTFEDVRKCFIGNFNRVCVVLSQGKDKFYIKVSDQMNDFIFIEEKCIDFDVRYNGIGKKGENEEKTIPFKKLYQSCIDNIKRHHNFGFMPYGVGCEPNDDNATFFNNFTGFKARYVENNEEGVKQIQPILDHIKMVLAAGDDKKYDYIMTYLANIVQKPQIKTKILMMFYSQKEQIGKGIVIEWILKQVFGLRHTAKTGSIKTVVGDFNALTKHKILIAIDEVANDAKYSERESEKFKTLITDTIQTINPKGVDPYQTLDCTNYIMMTNNPNAWKISENDKRIVVFDCDCTPRSKEYFNELAAVMQMEGSADAFYTYLCDYSLATDLKCIPQTKIKQDMILQTSEQPIKYFQCVKAGDYTPKFAVYEKDGVKYATPGDIYIDFMNWQVEFGEKTGIYSKLKFSAKFCQAEFGDTKLHRFNDKVLKVFDVSQLLNSIKTYEEDDITQTEIQQSDEFSLVFQD